MFSDHIPEARFTDYTQATEVERGGECNYRNSTVCYGHYTECPRRKGPNFGRVFLRSNYTDITQNTYIQSSMVTEILAREV